MTTERKRSPHLWILFLLAIAGSALVTALVTQSLRSRKMSLEKALQYLRSEYVFGRMTVRPGTGKTLTVRLTLLTPEGDQALDRDFTVPGGEIYLESRILVIEHDGQERSAVFPHRLYSDTLPSSGGIDLLPLYVRDGFPANYARRQDDPEWTVTIKTLYAAAWSDPETPGEDPETAAIPVKMRLDAALHRGPFRDGRNGADELVVHPNGGLELREAP